MKYDGVSMRKKKLVGRIQGNNVLYDLGNKAVLKQVMNWMLKGESSRGL